MKIEIKMLYFFLSMALGAAVSALMAPWWVLMPVAAILSWFFKMKFWSAGMLALLSVFPVWYLIALAYQYSSGSELAVMIGDMFMGLSLNQLFMLTALIGGISAALGAFAGSTFGQILKTAP
jgi:hypothetical protein